MEKATYDSMEMNDEPQVTRPRPDLLNESQRRAVATVLRRVELAVWRLEERLRQQTPRLLLTRFTHPPERQQRETLLHLIKGVHREIALLATDYTLEVYEEDLSRAITAEFTLLWCDLEDIRPQKLRNYGDIHPQAARLLGPPLQRLINLVLTIDSSLQENRPI